MSDAKTDTKVETQQQKDQDQVSLEELSKKVKDTTKEVNQLKNWLNIYTIEEKDRRLSEIEESILDCTQDLQYLETETLSNTDKDELKKLKVQIDSLKSSKDDLKQKIEKETKTAMDALSQEVAQSQSQSQENSQQSEWKEKWFLWRQRDLLTSKEEWKENTWKNILRVAWWIGIVAWICALWKRIFWWKIDYESEIPWYSKMSRKEKKAARKKLRKEKRAERKEEKWSFRERPIWKVVKWTWIWTGIYYVIHGIKTGRWNPKDFFDWSEKWASKLTIEESLSVVAWEINGGKIDENMYRRDFDKEIEYDEDNHLIRSYWESTPIDEKTKTLVWLEKVKFKDNIELVHAANIVNCLKHHLKWKWWAASAFSETKVGWDIAFCFSEKWATEVLSGSNTDLWKYILWTVWVVGGGAVWYLTKNPWVWIWSAIWLWAAWTLWWDAIDNNSSLWKCCSTIKDGDNFKLFISYLNNLKSWGESLWLPWKQEIEPDSKSPIQKYIREVVTEIENTNITEIDDGKSRDLKAEQDPQNPNRYKISSFGHSTYLTLNWSIKNGTNWEIDPSSIGSITIEPYTDKDIWWELKLNFPHTAAWLKESIKVVNLTNKIRKEYGWRWWEKYPIFYNQKDYYQGNAHTLLRNSKYQAWLWIDTNGDWQTRYSGQRIMTTESLSKYPTLVKDLNKSLASEAKYFEDQLNGKRNGSSYLKFLNGMRTTTSQPFWTQWQNV